MFQQMQGFCDGSAMLRNTMKGTLYNTVWWYCAVLRNTFANIKLSIVIVNYGTMKVHYLHTD
jgi:hypothetical protein